MAKTFNILFVRKDNGKKLCEEITVKASSIYEASCLFSEYLGEQNISFKTITYIQYNRIKKEGK